MSDSTRLLCVFLGGPFDGQHGWYTFDFGFIADPSGHAVIWRAGKHFFHQYIAETPVSAEAEVVRLLHRSVAARSCALPSATE